MASTAKMAGFGDAGGETIDNDRCRMICT